MTLKTYSSDIFPNGVVLEQLHDEIEASGSVQDLSGLSRNSDEIIIYGGDILDESLLDSIIHNYVPDFSKINIQKTVQENKEFADKLMQMIKEKNIEEGLTSIDQSAWVHQRMRKTTYTLSDGTTTVDIDIFNLVVSGDVETAEKVLEQLEPDDMTKPFHWFTEERITWIRNEIRKYLGWTLL